jgi:hypothetical protein
MRALFALHESFAGMAWNIFNAVRQPMVLATFSKRVVWGFVGIDFHG